MITHKELATILDNEITVLREHIKAHQRIIALAQRQIHRLETRIDDLRRKADSTRENPPFYDTRDANREPER